MKNLLLTVVGLVALGAKAHATALNAPNIATVAKSSSTCAPISVSTAGASVGLTDFIGSTTAINVPGWSFIQIRNLEASNAIYANESVSVSTDTGLLFISGAWVSGQKGDKIAAASKESYTLTPFQKWYGVCDKTSGTCAAIACKHD